MMAPLIVKRTLVLSIFIALAHWASIAAEGFVYEPHGRRDPFVPLVGREKPIISKLEDVTSIDEVKLEGIAVVSSGRITAILNGEMVKEGDKMGEVEIMKIKAKSVTISISGKIHVLTILEEGGKKSEK